jgi:hypothetical protein
VAGILGCGSGAGRHHAYHLGDPQVTQRGALVLALAVQDQRPYVLSRARRSNFVGLSRGTVGNRYIVTTVSGQSLSTDFATSIGRGLRRAGYSVETAYVDDRASLAQVRIALLQAGAQRGLAVQIREWKSDTFSGSALNYDVALAVFDAVGQEIGRTEINGHDVLVIGGHASDPGPYADKAVAEAYARKLEEMLNAPAIRRALAPSQPAPERGGAAWSTAAAPQPRSVPAGTAAPRPD